jgi:hypothetical protein
MSHEILSSEDAQAAPVPEKVRDIESDIKRESRRWAPRRARGRSI